MHISINILHILWTRGSILFQSVHFISGKYVLQQRLSQHTQITSPMINEKVFSCCVLVANFICYCNQRCFFDSFSIIYFSILYWQLCRWLTHRFFQGTPCSPLKGIMLKNNYRSHPRLLQLPS